MEADGKGRFRIARRVAKDRVISTVDPQARHGHKTRARGFDGYKGHAAVDPDSEIVTDTVVTPGNAGDGSVAEDLIDDLIDIDNDKDGVDIDDDRVEGAPRRTVYGDNAYGTGEFQQVLDDAGIESRCKTQHPTAPGGMFPKDRFRIDLAADTVSCPNGITVSIRRHRDGTGAASFAEHCLSCPLRAGCTTSKTGRQINVGVHETALVRARQRQQDPVWRDDYRATRPKVERKLAHLMRRSHGGRNARVRGTLKVDADFNLLAVAANFARLAVLGLRSTTSGWTVTS